MTKKIVTIGGGSGQSSLLRILKNINDIEISSVVTMSDSGSATGELIKKYNCLPTGDVVKCLIALARDEEGAKILLQRIKSDNILNRHYLANFALMSMADFCGDFLEAVKAWEQILETKGKVLPVTTDHITLVAETETGEKIVGEAAIDINEDENRSKIADVFLESDNKKKIKANSEVLSALLKADFIFLSYGDLYTSIIPNLLVPGVVESINKSKAKLVYLVNLETKEGETDGFEGEDFVLKLEKYLKRKIDIILTHENEQKNLVSFSYDTVWQDRIIIKKDLIAENATKLKRDSEKMKQAIEQIIDKNL